jgi:hypothetical protein
VQISVNDWIQSYFSSFYLSLPDASFFVLSLFLDIKMSAITIAEKTVATNPAGTNDETRESVLNLIVVEVE